jgi:hypothetical protein
VTQDRPPQPMLVCTGVLYGPPIVNSIHPDLES